MAKKRKAAKTAGALIPFNKKGAALAYTLIAAMVLMILSTSLLTAAESNITISTKNIEARRSYITCKSAVEYAKSIVLQRANSAKEKNTQRERNNLDNLANLVPPPPRDPAAVAGDEIRGTAEKDGLMHGFCVKPDTGNTGFKVENLTDADSAKLDGKNTLAKCVVTLKQVTRTTTQAVTACDTKKNSDGSFPVTAQMQSVTSVFWDLTKDMGDAKNWDQIGLPAPTLGSTPKTASTMTYFNLPIVEVLSVQDVYEYKIRIEASNQYSASDNAAQQRMQQLNYETDCIIGGSSKIELIPSAVSLTPVPQNPGIEIFAVGGQYGSKNITNGNNLGSAGNGISKLPVVFKNEIISSGSDSSLSAPAAYFMNSDSITVKDTFPITDNVSGATLDSDFIYFNGNIKGILDTNGNRCSVLRLKNTRKSLKLNNEFAGIVQFPKIKIQLVSASADSSGTFPVTTKELSAGLYYFKDGTNLFDFSKLDSNLKQVPETDYAAICSVADQNYVNYLQSNINEIYSADLKQYGGIEWIQNGDISEGKPSNLSGKTVYCYVNSCSNWINIFNNNANVLYGAKNIVFQWDNAGSNLTVPSSKTVTFQADYMVMNTNQAIKAGDSSSKFIVVNNSGTGTLTMVFPTDTVIMYAGSSYAIKAGTYGKVPYGINLFSSQAKNCFVNPANRSDLVNNSSAPDSPGKSSIQLDPFEIHPVPANLFSKGKYTNE